MEAAADVDAVDAVPVVGDDGLDLVQGVGIASARDTDVDVLFDHEHVAAVEDPRLPNMGERTMGLERPFDGRPFTAPGGHSGPSDDGDFVEDYGDVLDENRVGQIRFLVEALDPTPEFTKGCFIEGVLRLGNVNVNWRAIEVGEFAASDGRAHAPSDGDTHAGDRNRTLGVTGVRQVSILSSKRPVSWRSHQNDPVKETTIRAAAILVGLVMFGVGIGTLFLADLGVGPWDVLHDALAGLIDRQPGTVIIGLGLVLLVLVAALRQPIGPATVANVVIIGSTVNALMAVVEPPSSVAVRALLVAAAPILVAFGSMLYLGAGLGTGVRDGLMTALVDAGFSIRAARTCLEVTVLVGGGALGGSYGIGTLTFALLVGPLLQVFRHRVWAGYPELTGWVYRRHRR